MLTRIDLQCFKCFETLRLPLHRLTLLSGLNASGKSSVMQALVLLHQTMREHEWSQRLMLNGDAVRLGAVRDVIDQVGRERGCSLALEDDHVGLVEWEFGGEQGALSMSVLRVQAHGHKAGTWHKGAPQPLQRLLPEMVRKRSRCAGEASANSALVGRTARSIKRQVRRPPHFLWQ